MRWQHVQALTVSVDQRRVDSHAAWAIPTTVRYIMSSAGLAGQGVVVLPSGVLCRVIAPHRKCYAEWLQAYGVLCRVIAPLAALSLFRLSYLVLCDSIPSCSRSHQHAMVWF